MVNHSAFIRQAIAHRTALVLSVIVFGAAAVAHAQDEALIIQDTGNVGLGLDTPVRQIHMQGNNAAFRMDRDVNGAVFFLTRTAQNDFDTVWKTFAVGARAYGVNDGEFVINDLGTAVDGPGTRRMTIANDGTVIFTGQVQATAFNVTSSLRYKDDVETLTGVPAALDALRGVRFAWKESGAPDIGLIAEEVAEIYPELVQRDATTGAVESVNYPAMVAVLVEGFKVQQQQLALQEQRVRMQEQALDAYKNRLAAMEEQQDELLYLKAQINEMLSENRAVLAQR